MVGSNFVLFDASLLITYRKPCDIIAKSSRAAYTLYCGAAASGGCGTSSDIASSVADGRSFLTYGLFLPLVGARSLLVLPKAK